MKSSLSPPEKFDAFTVPLQDNNLIEASAGTGKTYSIGIMVLRLLLEKSIPINQILMVTFTKAAVAELEERVRFFVRSAFKASHNEPIKEDSITSLVNNAISRQGLVTVQQCLQNAVLFLDETSVLTIHSFCQQTLTTFAFETNQLFGAETLQDTSLIVSDEVNKFWRNYITNIPVPLLQHLINASLTRNSINSIVKEHLNGKNYIDYDHAQSYQLTANDFDEMYSTLLGIEKKVTNLKDQLYKYIVTNQQLIIDYCTGNKYVINNVIPLLNQPETFVNIIWEKRNLVNVEKVFSSTLLPQIQLCEEALQQYNDYLHEIIKRINYFAINRITRGVNDFKQKNNLLSFDDMIVNLHKALVTDQNNLLKTALRKKYQAVFIDEFQDTDKLQYEIFEEAFGKETILFYIGDPKQSIYAWRKADIFTYFKASHAVSKRYNMNQNFRSSEKMIAAMNLFFLPQRDFDTFYFGDNENAIKYIHVESPLKNKKGNFYLNFVVDVPISVVELNNKDSIAKAVAEQVGELLSSGIFSITTDSLQLPITPEAIGILVRTNYEAQTIKAALDLKGIPSVTINDSRIFESEETVYLLYLLQAINDLTEGSINKALLSPLTGIGLKEILKLDDQKNITLFRKYKSIWNEDGIYAALMMFVADYNIRQVLLNGTGKNGERIITNLGQLIEVVHKIQNDKNFSPTELIGWLQRVIEGMETEGDQYEQRVESDEEAVKIVTIHKSKGLEYKIVIAPFLDFVTAKSKSEYVSFRHQETGDYITVEKARLTDEQEQWAAEQDEQESRRLLYVAITRAVYKCFIYRNTHNKNSTLSQFIDVIKTLETNENNRLINFILPVQCDKVYAYRPTWTPSPVLPLIAFNLSHQNWTRLSYTMLASKGELSAKPRSGNCPLEYDQFIFSQLARGAKTGNLLHYLFENIDFSSPDYWQYHVVQAIKRFAPGFEKVYSPMLLLLLDHVTQSIISIEGECFKMADVLHEKRLNELEFDFNVSLFSPSSFKQFENSETIINLKYFEHTEGVMNGKVDLFFEHNNKFYILDWKSNYLGDDIKYYEPQLLRSAMSESNYHLQYLIYTVALKKYLTSRLPSFDYEKQFGGVIYMFVRGVRSGLNNGIFITRSSLQQIQALEALMKE